MVSFVHIADQNEEVSNAPHPAKPAKALYGSHRLKNGNDI
jgi:hypothetical protein